MRRGNSQRIEFLNIQSPATLVYKQINKNEYFLYRVHKRVEV